ncbi:kelch-like protein 22 [Eurytemora carolleeae]|uniref:kelch-like protein 22 n=1 Tax=Eurytemora carolleeae TaxID=1294199 RepID=UPI000C78DBC8|nr:kelch-like protein 22 [Eurytemora carolleeae]|eukprot:XP_023348300.1 kelch-like protein 22 [Eurytemora affinis]
MVEQDQHAIYILESLKDIYEAEDCFLSDITLVVGQEKLKAHKLILATQSDFFKGLFRNEKKDEVTIDICSYSTLSTILKYFYTGSSEITIENVQDILVAANFLQVKELIRKCSDFMARNLDLTNCVTVLRLGDLLNNEFLLQVGKSCYPDPEIMSIPGFD